MGCCHECDDKKILPNTVRAPSVPLYQLGWLGDDIPNVDPSTDLPWTETPVTIDASISYPDIPSNADIPTVDASGMPLHPPVVYGPPGPGQPGSGISPNPTTPGTYAGSSSFLTSLAQMFGPKPSYGLAPGPSPRVSSVPYGSSSFGSFAQYLPTIAIFGIGALVVSSLISGGRRR